MSFRNSSYTGRAARDLNSAFGPYTSNEIMEIDPPFDWQDKLVIAASVICIICVLALVLWDRIA